MGAAFIIRRTGSSSDAKVYSQGDEVGEVRKDDEAGYVLTSERGGGRWRLSPRVHGEVRPFSMTVTKSGTGVSAGSGQAVLTIRDSLFQHGGRSYTLMGTPEGRPLRDVLLGRRYICRLDSLPPTDLAAADHATRSTLHKLRGVPVGELDGLGPRGHRVTLSDELEDVALPLAVCSYLLYASA